MTWFTHFQSRRLEWLIAFYTVYFGMGLCLPPQSMSGAFSEVVNIMPETAWGAVYVLVGIIHALALHINGRSEWTPFARLLALILNSQVFLAMAIYLIPTNPFGTGVLTYGFFSIGFCGVAIASAAQDCGRELKIWRGKNDGRT